MKIINGILRNKGLITIGAVLSFISFSLCFFSLTNNYALYEQMQEIRDVFSSDLDKTYVMEFSYVEDEASFAEDINAIKEKIRNDYHISCGAYEETWSSFDELSTNAEYLKCNENVLKDTFYADMPDCSDMIVMDTDMLNFVDVGITKDMLEPVSKGGEKFYPLFVGKGYKDIIKVNDVLTDCYYGNKYIVKGYLDDVNWFDSSDAFTFPVSDMNYKFLTSFSDKEISDYNMQLNTVNKIYLKMDSADKIPEILQLASDKNLKISLTSIAEKFSTMKKENKERLDIQGRFAFTVLLCSIMSVSTMFCTSILINRREYGIRLAFGESKMRLVVNMIGKILVILSIMAVIAYVAVDHSYKAGASAFSYLYRLTLRNYALPIVALLIMVFILLSAVPPLLMINRLDLVQLIREENQ